MANVFIEVQRIGRVSVAAFGGMAISAEMTEAQIWGAIESMWGHMTEQQIIERLKADHPEWWQA